MEQNVIPPVPTEILVDDDKKATIAIFPLVEGKVYAEQLGLKKGSFTETLGNKCYQLFYSDEESVAIKIDDNDFPTISRKKV